MSDYITTDDLIKQCNEAGLTEADKRLREYCECKFETHDGHWNIAEPQQEGEHCDCGKLTKNDDGSYTFSGTLYGKCPDCSKTARMVLKQDTSEAWSRLAQENKAALVSATRQNESLRTRVAELEGHADAMDALLAGLTFTKPSPPDHRKIIEVIEAYRQWKEKKDEQG